MGNKNEPNLNQSQTKLMKQNNLFYKNSKGLHYLENTSSVSNKQYCKMWEEEIRSFCQDEGSEHLFLPETFIYRSGICGSAGTLTSFYQNYPITLQQFIKVKDKLFSPFEMWYLLYVLCSVGACFQAQKRLKESISVSDVLMNKSGQVKVKTRVSFFEQFLKKFELIPNSFRKQHICCQIGQILLQAGTLDTEVDVKDNKLIKLKKYYPNQSQLIHIIESFCEVDEEKHMCCQRVKTVLEEYEKQILQLRPFPKSSMKNNSFWTQLSTSKCYEKKERFRENIIELLPCVNSIYVSRKHSFQKKFP